MSPWGRKSLRISMVVGPDGLFLLSRLFYLSPYPRPSPYLRLVFWASFLVPRLQSSPHNIVLMEITRKRLTTINKRSKVIALSNFFFFAKLCYQS